MSRNVQRLYARRGTDKGTVESYFRERVKDFKVAESPRSQVWRGKHVTCVVAEGWIGPGLLSLLGKLKAEIRWRYSRKKFAIHEPRQSAKAYAAFRREMISEGARLYEYDKHQAYLRSARACGIISNKTFRKFLKLSKQSRLFLLGALATVKQVTTFRDGVALETEEKKDEFLRKVWFEIVSTTDDEMRGIYAREGVAGYWVDAVFSRLKLRLGRLFSVTEVTVKKIEGSLMGLSDGRIFPLVLDTS